MSESFNPFQAPESDEHEVLTLADDTEFLISRSEILCRETVELPRVCIAKGITENLQQRQQSFYSTGVPIAGLLTFVLVIGAISLVGRFGGAWMILGLVAIGSHRLPWLLARLKFPGVVTIEATWYVSEAYLRICRWQQWISRGFIVVMAAWVGFAAGEAGLTFKLAANLQVQGPGMAVLLGIVGGLLSLTVRMERRLRLQGRRRWGPHKGLYSLGGHTRKFTRAVEALIHRGF